MLPILDKPIIQYVVEDAVAAGITDIIIVTGPHKRPIEDHFDRHSELEDYLEESGKHEMAERLREIADMANFIYVRQKGPAGTGTPILNCAHLLGDDPFMVLFGDDFFVSKVPRAVQLVQEYEELGKSIIALTPIQPELAHKYGVPEITKQLKDDLFRIAKLVEKPKAGESLSSYASVSGYILTSDIIAILQQQQPQAGREFYLADAIDTLARQDEVYGKVIEGRWHDTGNKAMYLEAVVDMALEDAELGPDFRDYLKRRL